MAWSKLMVLNQAKSIFALYKKNKKKKSYIHYGHNFGCYAFYGPAICGRNGLVPLAVKLVLIVFAILLVIKLAIK